MIYLGDFQKNAIVNYIWETCDASGNSMNPTVSGVAIVYQSSNTTQSTSGITYTVGFDGLVGVHNVQVDTSNPFYTIANDYSVIVSGITLDSRIINTTLMKFSLENRYDTKIYDTLNTVSGNLTLNNSIILTTSGNLTTVQNTLNTVSGNLNNPITVSGITAPALSQMVVSGNAANWAADTVNVTVSGFTSNAIGNMASGIFATTIDGITASGILELTLAMVNGDFSYDTGTKILTIKRRNGSTLTTVSLPDNNTRTRLT